MDASVTQEAPFSGTTPLAYITQKGIEGAKAVERTILMAGLQRGLRRSGECFTLIGCVLFDLAAPRAIDRQTDPWLYAIRSDPQAAH